MTKHSETEGGKMEWKRVIDKVNDDPEKFEVRQCYCVGPQNGEPKCPCMLRAMERATKERG